MAANKSSSRRIREPLLYTRDRKAAKHGVVDDENRAVRCCSLCWLPASLFPDFELSQATFCSCLIERQMKHRGQHRRWQDSRARNAGDPSKICGKLVASESTSLTNCVIGMYCQIPRTRGNRQRLQESAWILDKQRISLATAPAVDVADKIVCCMHLLMPAVNKSTRFGGDAMTTLIGK